MCILFSFKIRSYTEIKLNLKSLTQKLMVLKLV